jgi:hypothetical protein
MLSIKIANRQKEILILHSRRIMLLLFCWKNKNEAGGQDDLSHCPSSSCNMGLDFFNNGFLQDMVALIGW